MPRASIIGAITAAAVLIALSADPARCADPVTETEEKPPGAVDTGHAGTSEQVRRLGAWVDRFFADENYEAEVNESSLRIRLDSFSKLYEGTDVDARARLRLVLPALNKRVRFEILSPGEPDDLEATGSEAASPPQPGAVEEKSSAAISYFIRAVKDRTVIVRLGTTFDGYTPNPYVGARYRELVPLNEDWNFRFIERVRFYSIDGLESRTSLDFERILEEDTLFRTSLDGTWLQEDPDYFYSLAFALFRPLDEKSAVEYQLTNSFRTDPHRLDRITARIRHRQKIWRDWLTFEVAPQVSFPDERDFKLVPGILFRLEATFGG
ncbi:MAG: hypothetical protein IMF05_16195 [Proteobacteria bacterium]|nr:hypothetical protein [Pseudomonadota bacterium]